MPRKRTPARKRPRRRLRTRRKGRARPMRSLRKSYRGSPNQYRFSRQLKSTVIDLGQWVIGAAPNDTVARYIHPDFQMNQLEQFVAEFGPLFTNYMIDKITVKLIPMWTQTVHAVDNQGIPAGNLPLPPMCITRLTTRWNTGLDPIASVTTDDGLRSYIAQTQMQSNTMYGSRKPLTLVTRKPRLYAPVQQLGPHGGTYPTNVEPTLVKSRWLDINNASDVDFAIQAIFIAQTVSQDEIPRGVYLYRVVTKVDFRVSLVH